MSDFSFLENYVSSRLRQIPDFHPGSFNQKADTVDGSSGVDQETRAALRLQLIPGIGPRLTQLLLDRFISHELVFRASSTELGQVPGIGPKLIAAIIDKNWDAEVDAELARCQQHHVEILPIASDRYPASLREIPDPPQLLYVKGRILLEDAISVAIVGSRNCTHYGLSQAERLAVGLAQAGITVISGLARGIDAAAHRGAMKAGGRTLAVCAPGLGTIYPPEHANLAEEITNCGALISESPISRGPNRGLFPQRNRVISGMTLGVIVVEASRTSGSLHTSKHAVEQNREVFAVPGRVDQRESEGCLDLIRDGAVLVRDVNDVLEVIKPLARHVQAGFTQERSRTDSDISSPSTQPPATASHTSHIPPVSPKPLARLSPAEQSLYELIGVHPLHVDELLLQSSLDSGQVLANLTMLEIKKVIRRLPGNQLIRAD